MNKSINNAILKMHTFGVQCQPVQYGGNGVYFNIDIVDGVKIVLDADADAEKIQTIKKYVSRSGKLKDVGDGFFYGDYVFVLVDAMEYAAMIESLKKDKEYITKFWDILHNQGRQAADRFYYDTIRKNTLKVVSA